MNRLASKPGRATLERHVESLEARNLELARTLQIVEEARACLADQYDFAPIGFVTLDTKGCIREINLTAARLLGRERSHLLTMPFLTYVAKPECREFLRHLRQCRKEGAEVISDVAMRIGGRRTLPVELRSVPVLDPRRGDTVYRTAITDITERLRTGNALRESEERYREVVELSPDGIFILSEGDIVFVNPAALALCDAAKASDLIGRKIVDLVRPVFRKNWINDVLHASPASRQAPVEVKFTRLDGTWIEVEVIARDFTYESERAVLVLARDITQRRNAERQVLAISEREKAGFGRDLHDGLCQSLAGAACRAEALRNQLRKTHPGAASEADELAGIVRQCIEEARNLARSLYPVHMEKNGLVTSLYELAGEVTRRTGVECSVECDDSIGVSDPGIATNLYRIAQEAISNAINHGAAQSVLIHLGVNNGRTTLTLRDDGRGFPAKPKETGMGLYTMRYRAAMIGGSLDVQRDGARGTIVICSFPSNGQSQ